MCCRNKAGVFLLLKKNRFTKYSSCLRKVNFFWADRNVRVSVFLNIEGPPPSSRSLQRITAVRRHPQQYGLLASEVCRLISWLTRRSAPSLSISMTIRARYSRRPVHYLGVPRKSAPIPITSSWCWDFSLQSYTGSNRCKLR